MPRHRVPVCDVVEMHSNWKPRRLGSRVSSDSHVSGPTMGKYESQDILAKIWDHITTFSFKKSIGRIILDDDLFFILI